MGQILFCQAKKPLNKGFFLCSLMPLQRKKPLKSRFSTILLVPPTGLEPVTHRLRVYCSTN